MDAGLVVGLVGAILGLLSTIYTARQTHQASQDREEREAREARLAAEDGTYRRAEAFDVGSQQRMQAEINRQAEQIHTLQRRVNRLTRQLVNAGLAPEEENELA
ncbi:SMC interacting uncharacterized protein involved in chromosome segregation [Streptosporangium album]|uniref:SMC interacting uncharacterized protein involved in chromosome segregation n=1 Tax=Streptosporangium album TaxID=47479 RepID=A0A7W7W7F0_9ACTN|nr:hypothetical protein [Streptosporangium album]MBB4935984.1 SMC interacting uncharacterized protein involved in chromosome segregation [Streptosporangium album]